MNTPARTSTRNRASALFAGYRGDMVGRVQSTPASLPSSRLLDTSSGSFRLVSEKEGSDVEFAPMQEPFARGANHV